MSHLNMNQAPAGDFPGGIFYAFGDLVAKINDPYNYHSDVDLALAAVGENDWADFLPGAGSRRRWPQTAVVAQRFAG